MKKPGKPITTDTDVKKQLMTWVTDNVPKNAIKGDEVNL
jgi:hypothetical protein